MQSIHCYYYSFFISYCHLFIEKAKFGAKPHKKMHQKYGEQFTAFFSLWWIFPRNFCVMRIYFSLYIVILWMHQHQMTLGADFAPVTKPRRSMFFALFGEFRSRIANTIWEMTMKMITNSIYAISCVSMEGNSKHLNRNCTNLWIHEAMPRIYYGWIYAHWDQHERRLFVW